MNPPDTTNSPTRRRGLELLGAAAIVAFALLWPRVFAAAEEADKALANPIEQRAEMIRLLKSIDERLAQLTKALER